MRYRLIGMLWMGTPPGNDIINKGKMRNGHAGAHEDGAALPGGTLRAGWSTVHGKEEAGLGFKDPHWPETLDIPCSLVRDYCSERSPATKPNTESFISFETILTSNILVSI